MDVLNDLKDKNADKHGVQNYVETLQYLLGCARVAVEEALDVREINNRNIGIARYEEDDYSRRRSDDKADDALLSQVQVDYRKEERNKRRGWNNYRDKRSRNDSGPTNIDLRGDEIKDFYGNPVDQRGNDN